MIILLVVLQLNIERYCLFHYSVSCVKTEYCEVLLIEFFCQLCYN